MPQAVGGWLAGLASSAGYGAAIQGIAYGVGYVATVAAIGYGTSRLSMELMDKPTFGEDVSARLDMYQDSLPPKRFLYGECRVSGPMAYMKAEQYASGDKRLEMLHYIVCLAGHEVEGINDNGSTNGCTVYLNHYPAVIDTTANEAWPDGDAASTDSNSHMRLRPNSTPYFDDVMIKLYNGTQTYADADAVATTNFTGSDGIASTAKGQGICYVYVRAMFDADTFTTGYPKISIKLKGKNDIYDPRDASTGYTDNCALCLADYLTTPREFGGLGIDWSDINTTELNAAANICDEDVTVYGDSTTQKRYRVGGTFLASAEPQAIIQAFLQAMAGTMEIVNGKWVIRAGAAYSPPSTHVQFTESDWLEPIALVATDSKRDIYNAVKPVLATDDSDWQETDVELVRAEDYEELGAINTTTDTIPQPSNPFNDDDRVRFDVWTGSAFDPSLLPGELSEKVYYWIVNADASTFQVASSEGGTPIDFSADISSGTLIGFLDVYLTHDKERIIKTPTYSMVNDVTQARRLGLIALNRSRREITMSVVANLRAFDLMVRDTIRVIDRIRGFWERTNSAQSATTAASNTISDAAHGHGDGQAIVVNDAASSGIEENRPMYVVNSDTDTFQIALAIGHSPITFTPSETIEYQTIQGKLFEVKEWQLESNGGNLAVAMTLRETADSVWDWNNGYVIEPDALDSIEIPELRDVPAPSDFTAESGTDQLILRTDGSIQHRVKLSWTTPDNAFVVDSGGYEIEYKTNGSTSWASAGQKIDGAITEHYILDVEEGVFYDFRIRSVNVINRKSNWSTIVAHEVLGKTEPPDQVTAISGSYDELNIRETLTWTDPADLDLERVDIYFAIDTGSGYGTAAFLASVPAGVERYVHEKVYSQGTSSDWKWIFKTVDTSGNVSTDDPWPEYIETVDPITGVTDFAVTARTAANGGLQINATWTDDSADCDVATQHWRKDTDGDHIGAEIQRTKMSKEAVDIDIPYARLDVSGGAYIATDYWVRAWRVFLVNGQEVWSDAVSLEVSVQPDQKAPPRPTAINVNAYDITEKSVSLDWSDPEDERLFGIEVYRKKASVTTKQTFLESDIIGVAAPGQQKWEDFGVWADGTTAYFHYSLRAVDLFGNRSTLLITRGTDWDYVAVQAASAPTITSVTARSEGSGIEIVWPANAAYANDSMWIQWGKDGDETTIDDKTVPYKEGTNYGTTIFLPAGSAGDWWVRIYRVSTFDSRPVWSQPYNHGSLITVTEDTVAPATPTGLTATADYENDYVFIEWNANAEADIQEYHLWRDRYTSGAWEGYVKIANIPASQSPTDKPSYTDPIPWQRDAGGTNYRYQVKAIDRAGNGSSGAVSSTLTIGDTTAPSAPTSFSYTWRQAGALLTFTPPRDLDYSHTVIQRKQGVAGSYVTIDTSRAGVYFDSTTGPNTDAHESMDDFYYRIYAVDTAGNASGYTTSDGSAGLPTAPSAITDLAFAAAVKDTGSIILPVDWTQPTGAKWIILEFLSDAGTGVRHETWVKASQERYQTPYLQSTAGDEWTVNAYVVDHWGNVSASDTDTLTH